MNGPLILTVCVFLFFKIVITGGSLTDSKEALRVSSTNGNDRLNIEMKLMILKKENNLGREDNNSVMVDRTFQLGTCL